MEYAQMFTVSGEWLVSNAMSLIVAIIIAVVGWNLANFLANHSRDLLPKTRRVDATIAPLLAHVVRYGIIIITAVIVLGQFGVQTASILAVLGAAGLAIALALQGTLSNLAAGIMLVWLRPFNVGDYVKAEGIAGTIVEIGLFATRVRTYDGLYVFAPNSKIWDSTITNYTREKTRMIETKVGISYGANIGEARTALLRVAEDPRILPEPKPFVFVDNLGDSAVVVGLRCWVKSSEWWQTNVDLREQAKVQFDAAGIEIPYNKVDVYIKEQAKAAPDTDAANSA